MWKSPSLMRKQYWQRVIAPQVVIVLLALSAMAYYFKRCTGSPLVTPYLVNVRMYETAPLFPWQELNTQIRYRHPSMAQIQLGEHVQQYESARHEPVTHFLLRVLKAGLFFSGPLLMLPWFVMGVILPYGLSIRDLGQKTALLMKICFFSILGMSLPIYYEPYYTAPVCCALYALEIQAVRRMFIFNRHGRQTGKLLVRYMLFACVTLLGIRAFSKVLHLPSPPQWYHDWESTGGGQGLGRTPVEAKLVQDPGRHLVIVRYRADRDSETASVANGSDLENSRIVWARDMGLEQNAELIRYYPSRKVWLLEPDDIPPQLSSYPVKDLSSTRLH